MFAVQYMRYIITFIRNDMAQVRPFMNMFYQITSHVKIYFSITMTGMLAIAILALSVTILEIPIFNIKNGHNSMF